MRFARWAVMLSLSSFLFPTSLNAAEFPPVTPEELKMTGVAEQPGAPAVILNREETDSDMLAVHSVYERIKILTDEGRKYADIEIPYSRRHFSITGASGQTVHADGSVIRFDGRVFDKAAIRGGGIKVNVKTFTLPDVQVGSVIDYRYDLRYDDNLVLPPTWEVQTELFTRQAYFKFIPFQNHSSIYVQLDHGQSSNGVAWTPFLGNGAQPKLHNMATATLDSVGKVTQWVDLNINDIPPIVEEPDSPPASITRWRVYFYYQESLKMEDYWKTEGKFWNKDVEEFISKGRGVGAALSQIIAPSDTPEQKVRKIYAFVGQLENQSYIPERTKQEEKVLELKANKGAEDVLEHRSGTHDDLNRLFVSLVRAAGIPASMIWVPDRAHDIFLKQYLSTRQLDAEIAIVQLDGKDIFLDPGTKFCPYGLLDWHYSGISGLRQNGKGTEIGETPSPTFRESVSTRMADVSLDQNGTASGRVVLVYRGLAAMARRREGGLTDADARKKMLEDALREILPGNSEITLTKQPDWDTTEAPLSAEFRVSFPFAISSGKRWLVPQHLFQINEKTRFASGKRTTTVYFPYPWLEADEVHITLPPGMEAESLAPDDSVKLDFAFYQVKQKLDGPGRIFSRRDFVMGGMILPVDQYATLKGFFDKVKSDDDQPALIKVTANVATK